MQLELHYDTDPKEGHKISRQYCFVLQMLHPTLLKRNQRRQSATASKDLHESDHKL